MYAKSSACFSCFNTCTYMYMYVRTYVHVHVVALTLVLYFCTYSTCVHNVERPTITGLLSQTLIIHLCTLLSRIVAGLV